jgi:hypothetical protein
VNFLLVISEGKDLSISVMSCVFPPAHFKNGFAVLFVILKSLKWFLPFLILA